MSLFQLFLSDTFKTSLLLDTPRHSVAAETREETDKYQCWFSIDDVMKNRSYSSEAPGSRSVWSCWVRSNVSQCLLRSRRTNVNARRQWTVSDRGSPRMTPGDSRDASASLFVWPSRRPESSLLRAHRLPGPYWDLFGPAPANIDPFSLFPRHRLPRLHRVNAHCCCLIDITTTIPQRWNRKIEWKVI